jgi:antitoxin component of MazEF toxin-antitoxin module
MQTSIKQWGNSCGIRVPKQAMESSNLNLDDDLEIITFDKGITFRKKERKTLRDIAKPLISTKDWKFDREEVNERH